MMRLDPSEIPEGFPVRPLGPEDNPEGKTTCGQCGLSWDDNKTTSRTPTPSARCPFEEFHITQQEHCHNCGIEIEDEQIFTGYDSNPYCEYCFNVCHEGGS